MGKSGVEPNEGLANAIWLNHPDRMVKAKKHARIARNRKDYVSAHSIMLSAYITALSGKPVEGRQLVKFFLIALWHAMFLLWRSNTLNHNKLDVLVQFLLKFRSRLPFTTSGRPFSWWRWHSLLDHQLIRLAAREIASARVAKRGGRAKPHQVALAFMTCAEVRYVTDFVSRGSQYTTRLEFDIKAALALENEIRAEPGQPQGLRQFVRVLRKAGELYMKPGMMNVYHTSFAQAQIYFQRALDLARGEANAPDQVAKILPLIHF